MAQISLSYPKIKGSKEIEHYNCSCIAFEKYDGTNLHWVWERELGWYAFGTRRSRFDLDKKGIDDFNIAHPGLEKASDIFIKDFSTQLEKIFRSNSDYVNYSEIIVFTEFLGNNSFAGMHKKEDEKQLVMFDVQTSQEIITPDRFIRDFQEFKIAKIIYKGKLSGKFINDVREGKFNIIEGVVCKGFTNNKLWMVKIKTNAYMKKLKETFKENWENYWE